MMVVVMWCGEVQRVYEEYLLRLKLYKESILFNSFIFGRINWFFSVGFVLFFDNIWLLCLI